MAVRVYGVEILSTDMVTIWRNFDAFRKKAAEQMLEYERTVLASYITKHIDRLTFRIGNPELTDLDADLRFHGIFSYEMKKYTDSMKSSDKFDFYQHSPYDPKLDIELYEYDGKIYATVYCLIDHIKKLLFEEPWVKDMSVFDSDTVDNGSISYTEWNYRQDLWSTIFGDRTASDFLKSSFSVSVSQQMNLANTQAADIVPYIDDFESRAEKYAKSVMITKKLSQYHQHSKLMNAELTMEVFGSTDPSITTLHFLAMDYTKSEYGQKEIAMLKNKILTLMEPVDEHPMF